MDKVAPTVVEADAKLESEFDISFAVTHSAWGDDGPAAIRCLRIDYDRAVESKDPKRTRRNRARAHWAFRIARLHKLPLEEWMLQAVDWAVLRCTTRGHEANKFYRVQNDACLAKAIHTWAMDEDDRGNMTWEQIAAIFTPEEYKEKGAKRAGKHLRELYNAHRDALVEQYGSLPSKSPARSSPFW